MGMLDELLAEIAPEWEAESGYGLDALLIAPDGCMVEQDGQCQHGYVSPLREAGLI